MNKHRQMIDTLRSCEVNSLDAVLLAVGQNDLTISGTMEAPALSNFFQTMFRADPVFKGIISEALEDASCDTHLH